ncbi:STAS domain-containing protein [Thioalkalivibrio sp. ALJ7]|uniref:STAS domain-containing protein n=1 Tax=Thioalkalivibrio sp. ALJ7 TaxID=1158756 RepID=UPI0003820C3D|nr:STAS domain-containing protein [Thioalkalivibrio sp. ALJ7]
MTTIALPERLRIDTATACWQELRVALDAGEGLQVDAAGVADIDAAGVQVLLMARHTAKCHAQVFSIDGASAVFAQAFQALGVDGTVASTGQEHDTDSGENNG